MLYSGVSILTLIPLPKVPSTLPLLEMDLEEAELTLGDETEELVARADWTAELIWGWRVAMIWEIRADWSTEEEELEDVLVLTFPEAVPAEEFDLLFLRELMEMNPSFFSEVAENPMAPAS